MLLSGELKPHTRLLVDVDQDRLVFRSDGRTDKAIGGNFDRDGDGGGDWDEDSETDGPQ